MLNKIPRKYNQSIASGESFVDKLEFRRATQVSHVNNTLETVRQKEKLSSFEYDSDATFDMLRLSFVVEKL